TLYGQAPAAFVGFAPQWIGEQIPNNNNGWLEEEPEEEEEEGDEVMEDDVEVINPYEEADPHNRPPPTSDEETEFAPPVVQIANVDNIPLPPVVQFENFFVGESSASRDLLEGNDEMHDRYKTEKRMAMVLRQEELCRNGQAFDITALDSTGGRVKPLGGLGEMKNSQQLTVPGGAFHPYCSCTTTMPPKRRSQTHPQLTLTQEDIDQLMQDGIAATVREEHERVRREATRAGGPARDPVTAPIAQEC
nr:hypothetical protein [Tanacetum cinerariifolium]